MKIILIAVSVPLLFLCFVMLCACRVARMADEKIEKMNYEKGNSYEF